MTDTTDDPNHPGLRRDINDERVKQADTYLVLSEEERAQGFLRPLRDSYLHNVCGEKTIMSWTIAETYARDPQFYSATYCVHCAKHRPVTEFRWFDGAVVGS